ncbi:MAG: ubiquinol-cytochrome c reductase iron-sulfur subunit [Nitrospirae bacterium]|nr:ubiquinol-cytochrome c reductase iron-sulfur subunit [Nitrospirota bacterium]
MEQKIVNPESGREDTSRRRFLKWLLGIIAAVNALVAGVPFLRSLISPSSAARQNPWLKVASINSLPEGKPVDIRFMAEPDDAYIHTTVLRSVWVIRHSAGDITVFSPVCTHLGCYYQWSQQSNRFECPCHASLFSLDGKVLGGPAPRSLDVLPSKIENGNVYVKWERFKVGTPERIPVA